MDKGKKVISIVVFLITVVLVSLISIQFKTVEETNSIGIETMQEEELRKSIVEWKLKYEEVNNKVEANYGKIGEYTNVIQNNKQASEMLDNELAEYNMLVGKTNVVGEGIVLKLSDSFARTYSSGNLVYLINELKYAGAEAISINGQRIINMTDIVTIQEKYILINGQKINAPYEVKVIGDRSKLKEVLEFPKDGFIDDYRNQGYLIEMTESNEVHIPAYNQEIELKYLKEVEE